MPSPPQLAPEIIDYIIDFLYNDHDALKACSLVSHTFVTTSQYHLKRRLKVIGRPQSESIREDSFQYVLDKMDSNPDACQIIQELHLVDNYGKTTPRFLSAPACLYITNLSAILQRLPSVHILVLQDLTNIGMGTEEVLGNFSLTKLVFICRPSLSTLQSYSTTAFMRLLHLFVRIDDMCISGLPFSPRLAKHTTIGQLLTEPTLKILPHRPTDIRNVTLESTDSAAMILGVLRWSPPIPGIGDSIHSLDVDCNNHWDIFLALNPFVLERGRNLKSLRIKFMKPAEFIHDSLGGGRTHPVETMGSIDLSACTSLQSLTFSIILDDGLVPKAVAGLYTYMIDIIKTTQSTPLSHIHFEYNFVDFVPLTSMSDYLNRVTDFIKFDETLGSIPQLKSVTISTAYIGRTDGYDSPMLPPVNLNNRQVRTTFLDKLSSVASTGRLKFVPMPFPPHRT